MLAFGLLCAGCKEDARLAGQKIRHVEVGPVTDQDMTLDKQAAPKQVTFVLLRAIRDDVVAGKDEQAHEKALDRQFNVCAPEAIYRHCRRFYPAGFPVDRDEAVHRAVRSWAPTLALYASEDAHNFDFDWATAEKRMRERIRTTTGENAAETAVVLLEAEEPPPGPDVPVDPNASVMIQVQLVREQEYWRVSHVGFLPNRRHFKPQEAPATQPAASTPSA